MPNLSKFTQTVFYRMVLILIFLVIGILVVDQYLLYEKLGKLSSSDTPDQMAIRVSQLYSDNQKLKTQADQLTSQRTDLENAENSSSETSDLLKREKEQYEVMAGNQEVIGQGVTLTVDHYLGLSQLVDLVDALRNSGAEAIAINQKRVVLNTSLEEFQNKNAYVFEVIGDKNVLSDSLTRPGGILDLITNGKVDQSDQLDLPKA